MDCLDLSTGFVAIYFKTLYIYVLIVIYDVHNTTQEIKYLTGNGFVSQMSTKGY